MKLRYKLKEDGGAVPTNNAGGGSVAGIGVGPNGEPGVSPEFQPGGKKKRFKNAAGTNTPLLFPDMMKRTIPSLVKEKTLNELTKPTPETALKVVNRSVDRDEWSAKASNRLYKRYKDRYEPKPTTKTNESSVDPVNPDMHPAAKDVTEKKKWVKKEEVESSKLPKD